MAVKVTKHSMTLTLSDRGPGFQGHNIFLKSNIDKVAIAEDEKYRTYGIPYVWYSFPLCNSNFVFKTRRFYDIRLQKNVVTLKLGSKVTEGH